MAAYGEEEEELLIPPENFAMVEPAIYRSGFPSKKNFPFLKTLQLRTILYLCPEEYPEANLTWLTGSHVQLLQYGVMGNKEPFLEIPHGILSLALLQILDTRNHPLLIHCNKGKHRTGCMIGILHKALGWSLSAIFEEYRCFSTPKERFVDQQWIESWQMELPKEYIRYLQQQHERRKSIDSGESSSSSSSLEDAPALLNDKSKYLLNPEANEPPKPKEKGEKRAIVEAPSTTTHAMLHAASDKMPMLLQRPLSHHQHAMSQPNLLAMTHSNNMTAK